MINFNKIQIISLLVYVIESMAFAGFLSTTAHAQLASSVARSTNQSPSSSFDGVVEAVRQTVVAAQVSGAVVELKVKAGDRVKMGQALARLDSRAADQTVTAGQAQVRATRAAMEVAAKDFARQKLLFEKRFISQAALDQAEAIYKSAEAQVAAQIAQTGAARSQSDFYVLRAPYAGVVADVSIVLGDMAMPGRPILTLYDPALMRVTVSIPQMIDTSRQLKQSAKVEFPGAAGALKWITPTGVTVLPALDPNTHTVQLRLDLPAATANDAGTVNAVPGMFARVWLDGAGGDATRVFIDAKSIFRRAEMTGAYVLDPAGKPMLRQIRVGRVVGDSIEVLSGITVGERVATDPQAAARVR